MSQNMLVDRLKAAKRELTALKTAHKRGINLLRVFNYWDYNVPSVGGDLVVNITFNAKYASYPFFELCPYVSRIGATLRFGIANIVYTNNGYGARITIPQTSTYLYYSGICVVSAAPITGLSYG